MYCTVCASCMLGMEDELPFRRTMQPVAQLPHTAVSRGGFVGGRLLIHYAQIRVPSECNRINKECLVVEWDDVKVEELHSWPYHVIRLHGPHISLSMETRSKSFMNGWWSERVYE